MDWLFDPLTRFFNWILNSFSGFFTWLGELFASFWNGIVGFFAWLGLALNTLLEGTWNLLANIWQGLQQLINALGNLVSELVAIIQLLAEIFMGFIGLIGAYLGQAITLMTSLFADLTGAEIVPIPGMPRCVSAPQESDICALWYVLEHTIFKGTLGDAILTVIIVLIDIYIVYVALKTLMTIFKKTESVSDAA